MHAGDAVADQFDLLEAVGSGGTGKIYRARDRDSGELLAVKILREQFADARFEREAKVLAGLRHPAIVKYVAHGTMPSGERYLAMEWLEGEDLARRIGRSRLSVDETIALGTRVAEAVAEVHARGVVHRDLKPGNLFLVGGQVEQVKVLDFGVAQLARTTRMTKTGMLLGTLGYMAPEQARGVMEIDARADVFALGCVLFECLSGEPVFSGSHPMALLAKILYAEPRRVRDLSPGVPAGLDALITRMLAKDPSARPSDAAEVVAALGALGEEEAAPRSLTSVPAAALTEGERRLLSVVFLERDALGEDHRASRLRIAELSREDEGLREAAAARGGKLTILAGGSAVVTIMTETGAATDQAAQAARCALALRAISEGCPMSLSTGRAEMTGKLPMSDAIDRAAQLLEGITPPTGHASLPIDDGGFAPSPGGLASRALDPPPQAIAIDELTAALLDARFDVREGEAGLELHGERALAAETRTLLGKATACVGRDWELGTLSATFAECVDDQEARGSLVIAAAGVGKSRVAREFLRTIRQREEEVEVWIGRGDALLAGLSFGVLGQALEGACGIARSEPLEARREKLLSRVGQHVAAAETRRVTEFFGEIIGTPFPDEESAQLRAARKDPQLMGEQTARAFEDFLEAETEAHPVLLMLEDLHWGDRSTVRLITGALRSLRQRPWMVLALARPEARDLFPQLWATRGVQEIRLTRLSRKASERLARQVLGDSVSPATMARVAALADGNAFYLEELLRAVAEGQDEALPDTVVSMVEARLMGLSGGARRLLRAASVFGEVFWPGGLMALLGGDPLRSTPVDTELSTLVDKEVLVRWPESRFSGEPTYAFRHALLREGAHAMLTEEDRALGHRLAGEWLLSQGESDPAVLAEHFERGGEPARAVAFCQRAAEQALRGQDSAVAIDRAERGIRCGAEGETRASLLSIIGEASLFSGDLGGALLAIDQVVASSKPGSVIWCRAISTKLLVSRQLGQPQPLRDIMAVLAGVEPDEAGVGALLSALGPIARLFLGVGQFEIAEAYLKRVEQLGGPHADQDPAVRGWLAFSSAARRYFQGDRWAALGLFERAATSFEEVGERRHVLAMAHIQICMCYLHLGAYAEARRAALALVTHYDPETIGARVGRMLLAFVRTCLGEVDEGIQGMLEEIALPTATSTDHMVGNLRSQLALSYLRQGDIEAAEREALAASSLLTKSPIELLGAFTILADARLWQRRADLALSAVERALSIQRAFPPVYAVFPHLALVHAEALDANGDHARAREIIADARADLLARAEKISDPGIRRSFLEDVPENARTIERAEAWLGPIR